MIIVIVIIIKSLSLLLFSATTKYAIYRPSCLKWFVTMCKLNRHYNQETIKGTERASPYTPYSIGNLSLVIFNTTDLKGD